MEYIYGCLAVLAAVLFFAGEWKYAEKGKGIGYGAGKWLYQIFERYAKKSEEHSLQYRKIQVAPQKELRRQVEQKGIELFRKSLLVFFCIQLVGMAVCLYEKQEQSQIRLQREDYGGEEKEYELSVALENRTTQQLNVTVSPRQYSEEQLEKLFQKGFSEGWKQVLGENSSFEQVTKPLQMVTELEAGPLEVRWWWEDEEYILENGELNYEEIGEEARVTLYLELKYGEDIRQQCRALVLRTPIHNNQQLLLQNLEKKIVLYDQKNLQEPEVSIPAHLLGTTLKTQESSFKGYFLFLAFLLPLLFWLKWNQDMHQQLEERRRQLLREYPEFINKLVLYLGAGMTLKHCFLQLYQEYQQRKKEGEKCYLYEEIGVMVQELNAGVSEPRCYEQWGRQLGEPVYIKLCHLLIQNLSKGSEGLLVLLQQEMQQALREKRESARRYGEEAGTKLLFPMLLLLVAVMVIVMAPAILNFSMG
ncbi:MAG: hypothetical protein PUC39_06365 [Lachnospiraceae bacterium]|nr:hypothetical protein [Lachnospiraceae bacterium]